MTWLLGLMISVLTVLLGVNLWEVVLLWRVTTLLQTIQTALNAWEQPQTLAQPLQDPGSAFVVSDRELAMREKNLMAESRQRVGVGSAKSRRSLSRTMG